MFCEYCELYNIYFIIIHRRKIREQDEGDNCRLIVDTLEEIGDRVLLYTDSISCVEFIRPKK